MTSRPSKKDAHARAIVRTYTLSQSQLPSSSSPGAFYNNTAHMSCMRAAVVVVAVTVLCARVNHATKRGISLTCCGCAVCVSSVPVKRSLHARIRLILLCPTVATAQSPYIKNTFTHVTRALKPRETPQTPQFSRAASGYWQPRHRV